MNERAAVDAIEIESLLRGFGDRLIAQRRLRWYLLAPNPRTIAVALLACLALAPGCAAGAIFLMAESRAVEAAEQDAELPLMKSNRLQPMWRPSEILHDRVVASVRPALYQVAADLDPLVPAVIRGRIEDAVIETVAYQAPASPATVAAATRQKIRRDVSRAKAPKIVAENKVATESNSSDASPLSFLKKLFGYRST
jgi:hypothetical protein